MSKDEVRLLAENLLAVVDYDIYKEDQDEGVIISEMVEIIEEFILSKDL